jgi:asparagine synthase (glutamine-hydrolysing)
VPALKYLQGPYLDLVREALHAPAAKERGLFEYSYVERLITKAEHDEEELTPLRGNKLWQLGLLELWLQSHNI